VSVRKESKYFFQDWWNLSVCFTGDIERLSLKCRTHKEQQREHKHIRQQEKAGLRDGLCVDLKIGQTTCASGTAVLDYVTVCVFLRTFNG